MLPNSVYRQFEAPLAAGDRLIVVSDGIVEALNGDGEFWDEEEVDRVVVANRDVPLSRLPRLLVDAVDHFAAGAEQYDDMTVVALRIE
jgi:sigma-B regulation protein RsbU (phosphoserine phosphatase)